MEYSIVLSKVKVSTVVDWCVDKTMNRKTLLCFSLSMFLFLMLAACGGSSGDSSGSGNQISANYKSCSSNYFMTQSPISFSELWGITPLGTLNPPDHTQPTRHTYWYAGDPGNPPPVDQLAYVYAPGDIRVFEVQKVTYDPSWRPYQTDYSMRFFICDDVWGYFNHLMVLDESFEAMVGEFPNDNCETYSTSTETVTQCTKQLALDIPAGTLLGTVSYYGTLDFGMDDNRVNHTLANPNRFGFIRNAVCPMEYFVESEKDALFSITGRWDGSVQRTAEPRCGQVSFDEPGTAAGAWVLDPVDPNVFLESISVALAKDSIDPSLYAFSVGNIGSNVDAQVLTFTPNSSGTTNRAFEDVTPDGNVYCYNVGGGLSIALQMSDRSHLLFDVQSSDCSGGAVISASAIRLQR